MSLTPEREAEMRHFADGVVHEVLAPSAVRDLLSEIDRLRPYERRILTGCCLDETCGAAEERDRLRAEIEALREAGEGLALDMAAILNSEETDLGTFSEFAGRVAEDALARWREVTK